MTNIHLIVLVHGVWGTVHHFDYIAAQLQERGAYIHDPVAPLLPLQLNNNNNDGSTQVIVYRAKCNQGYFTYDGIDVCGARLVHEIEDELAALSDQLKVNVTHISIIGYSLGGLISRYAIGLLYTSGLFDRIKPVCYTSFCSPHVGVRALGTHWSTRTFNMVGTYSMSSTSRQLFLADNFHNRGRPLLELMSDGSLPFCQGLAAFQRRIMYANVINDHRCEFYTSAVEPRDLMGSTERILEGPFVEGYEPVVLRLSGDGHTPNEFIFSEIDPMTQRMPSLLSRIGQFAAAVLRVTLGIPLWFIAFCCNAFYQTVLSSTRQKLFYSSARAKRSSWDFGSVHFEEALEDEVESVIEQMYQSFSETTCNGEWTSGADNDSKATLLHSDGEPVHSLLNPCQKNIIYGLNKLDWLKYPVYIRKASHTHAAVIVRYKSPLFDEGKIAVKHWLDNCLDVD